MLELNDIILNHFNERSIFNIKIAIQRGYSKALLDAFKKFSYDLEKNNLSADENTLRKRFEELGHVELFDDNINEIRSFLIHKTDNSEEASRGELYSDLTPRARDVFFRYLNDGNIKRYSQDAQSDPMTFKKVFIELIRELKKKNEKIKGYHLVNRMLEAQVNPEYWNDQLNSIKSIVEDLEGKKPEPFVDEELQNLAKDLSENLPEMVSKEKIEESEKIQKLNIQENRFIKMQLNLSTQLRNFEGHLLKSALEGKNDPNAAEARENLNMFIQELATMDEIDHDKVSVISVEEEVEGIKRAFPAIRIPFKNDFNALKKNLADKVYSSKLTPYFTDEVNDRLVIRNSNLEKEAVLEKNNLTLNLGIEPAKRLARHTESFVTLKKLLREKMN